MAYVRIDDEGGRGRGARFGAALGCGPGCACAPCRRAGGCGGGRAFGFGERYVRDDSRDESRTRKLGEAPPRYTRVGRFGP
jgi:hypothetical protein